jgi:NAD-dependent dihydropyrimidine dehydrogenase PreA subunit
MEKQIFPTIKINLEGCISCGVCFEICPTDVFRMDSGNKPKPYVQYPSDCQACFLCEFDCPAKVIKVEVHRFL